MAAYPWDRLAIRGVLLSAPIQKKSRAETGSPVARLSEPHGLDPKRVARRRRKILCAPRRKKLLVVRNTRNKIGSVPAEGRAGVLPSVGDYVAISKNVGLLIDDWFSDRMLTVPSCSGNLDLSHEADLVHHRRRHRHRLFMVDSGQFDRAQ
jgi:hypothetical protein